MEVMTSISDEMFNIYQNMDGLIDYFYEYSGPLLEIP